MSKRSPAWIVCRGIVVLTLSGLGAATLVRLAPGFGIAEQALDPRLSAQTVAQTSSLVRMPSKAGMWENEIP